jgi:hypothetical protein
MYFFRNSPRKIYLAIQMNLENMMTVNFARLSCEKGCCLDKVKHLSEQIFHQQDEMYNSLAEENIELGNFVVDEIMPYLEARAQSHDHRAQDLMVSLMTLLRGV